MSTNATAPVLRAGGALSTYLPPGRPVEQSEQEKAMKKINEKKKNNECTNNQKIKQHEYSSEKF